MEDIVERLRELAKIDNCQVSFEAADEIERLREENKQLTYRLARIDGTYDTMFSVVEALKEKE